MDEDSFDREKFRLHLCRFSGLQFVSDVHTEDKCLLDSGQRWALDFDEGVMSSFVVSNTGEKLWCEDLPFPVSSFLTATEPRRVMVLYEDGAQDNLDDYRARSKPRQTPTFQDAFALCLALASGSLPSALAFLSASSLCFL